MHRFSSYAWSLWRQWWPQIMHLNSSKVLQCNIWCAKAAKLCYPQKHCRRFCSQRKQSLVIIHLRCADWFWCCYHHITIISTAIAYHPHLQNRPTNSANVEKNNTSNSLEIDQFKFTDWVLFQNLELKHEIGGPILHDHEHIKMVPMLLCLILQNNATYLQ